MSAVDSAPSLRVVNPRAIASVQLVSYVVPILAFLSGIVFMQYGNFCSLQVSSNSRLPFRLATIGTTLHLAQFILDMWYMCVSFQSYVEGHEYKSFHYTAMEIWMAVGIILIVQYHYFSLARDIPVRSKKWSVAIGALGCATCLGGFATGLQFELLHGAFQRMTRPLMAFYISWLGCNCLTDGTIAIVMMRRFFHDRTSVRHKSLRSLLGRLFALVVNTFALTFFVSFLCLLFAVLPYLITSLSITMQTACHVAAYMVNGMLPRVYLISYFSSFQQAAHYKSQSFDSCVASLRWNMDNGTHSPSPQAFAPAATKLRILRTCQVTIEIEEKTEENWISTIAQK